jgi:hypothetical protein
MTLWPLPSAGPSRDFVDPDQILDSRYDSLAPYRHLALTIIAQAFRDLTGNCSPADRESAQAFLAGSPRMRHWCQVAGVDATRLIVQARQLPRHLPPIVDCP